MLTTAFTVDSDHDHPMTGGGLAHREPQDALAERLAAGVAHTLEAREHLFCEGDQATHVYRVEVGHICIYRMMPDGRRQVVDFAYPGDVIGLGALGEHADSAQAMERTVVRGLPVATLKDLARFDSQLGIKLYEALSRELLAARELLFTVSQRTAAERVAAFLMALSRRNERRGEKPDEIVLPMTRMDIADFLGLTIETVSRTFTRLRTDGVIDLEQCILVTIRNPGALQALAEGGPESRAR
ncbi:MAG: helix-turn-helix domain-containing protein [Hyphomicrobiaceae bacterium]|nr:helix-turn-helix domain-containing protein [Hyphomicrobiaceae bacterium]